MTLDDIPAAMRLKDVEGWNQTLKDWDIMLGGRNHINYVAEKDDQIVGTVTAINYANDVAWIGMMIVDRAYRGQGISNILLNKAIDQLREIGCKCIKLDATPAGQPVYRKLGFIDEYVLVRMTNPAFDAALPDSREIALQSVHENHIDDIIAFDRKVFGAQRELLIRSLIKDYPEKARILIKNNKMTGFVLGRDGVKFNQIGPVSASEEKEVMALITTAARDLKGKPVVIDVLEDRAGLIKWLESLGFTRQRPFYRMYLDENPFPGNMEKQYLICGPEFG